MNAPDTCHVTLCDGSLFHGAYCKEHAKKVWPTLFPECCTNGCAEIGNVRVSWREDWFGMLNDYTRFLCDEHGAKLVGILIQDPDSSDITSTTHKHTIVDKDTYTVLFGSSR